MRIDKLFLLGFGRFSGRTMELAPGLNIIYGQNEAGKSTIQKFILGMLYGFKKKAQRREYTADSARFRPWNGEEYRGAIAYTLDSGRTFRVERQFDPRSESVRVFDSATGADLTARFVMDRRKEMLFAEDHLRLPEEVFRSTAWVGQLAVNQLEMGKELLSRVANLQESGREDLSVRGALRAMEERMKEIGSDRAPSRPYARLCRMMEEKRLEVERSLQVREQTLAWEAQLTEVRAALAELEFELSGVQQRWNRALLREAAERLERVESVQQSLREARERAEHLASYAGFPVHLRERLIRCEAESEEAARQAAAFGEREAAVQADLSRLRARLAADGGMARHGDSAAAEIIAARHLSRSAQTQVPPLKEEAAKLAEMVARLDEAIQPLQPAADKGAEILSKVEAIEREMGGLRLRMETQVVEGMRAEAARLDAIHRKSGGLSWLLGTGLSLAWALVLPLGLGHVLGLRSLGVLLAAGALVLIGAGCGYKYLLARSRAKRLGRSLAEARANLKTLEERSSQSQERLLHLDRERDRTLGLIGVSSTADVRNRVVRYEQLTARRDGQHLRLTGITDEISRIHGETSRRLAGLNELMAAALGMDGADVAALEDPEARFQAARSDWLELVAREDALERDAAALARRRQEEEIRSEHFRQEVQTLLSEAGVATAGEFADACAHRETWVAAAAEADTRGQALRGLLQGEDLDGLRERAEELRALVGAEAAVAQAAAADGAGVVGETAGSAALQAQARQLEARRSELTARASVLAARAETALGDLADTADLRRELAALAEDRQAYDEELAALELAKTVLSDVSEEMHREFAPKLNAAMGDVISRLTGGKYSTVKVDPELSMRAVTADHRTVDLGALSGGTIDQFYFGLRVALLDLLTEGQERVPLILDDPFVQYDARRLQASIAYLETLAGNRQILLMTCHQREVEASQSLAVPAHFIDISEG